MSSGKIKIASLPNLENIPDVEKHSLIFLMKGARLSTSWLPAIAKPKQIELTEIK